MRGGVRCVAADRGIRHNSEPHERPQLGVQRNGISVSLHD